MSFYGLFFTSGNCAITIPRVHSGVRPFLIPINSFQTKGRLVSAKGSFICRDSGVTLRNRTKLRMRVMLTTVGFRLLSGNIREYVFSRVYPAIGYGFYSFREVLLIVLSFTSDATKAVAISYRKVSSEGGSAILVRLLDSKFVMSSNYFRRSLNILARAGSLRNRPFRANNVVKRIHEGRGRLSRKTRGYRHTPSLERVSAGDIRFSVPPS